MKDTTIERIWNYIKENARFELPRSAEVVEGNDTDNFCDFEIDGKEITLAKQDINELAEEYYSLMEELADKDDSIMNNEEYKEYHDLYGQKIEEYILKEMIKKEYK